MMSLVGVLLGLAMLFIAILGYLCCVVAGRADQQAGRVPEVRNDHDRRLGERRVRQANWTGMERRSGRDRRDGLQTAGAVILLSQMIDRAGRSACWRNDAVESAV
jgi:hypothetical protein